MSLKMLRVAFWDPSQLSQVGKVTPGVQLYGWQEYGDYFGWFGADLVLVSAGTRIFVFRRRREHWREASAASGLVVVTLLTAGTSRHTPPPGC